MSYQREEQSMVQPIHYSDGSTIEHPVIVVWEDLHAERAGYFRAFWAASPDATSGSPIVGYCSPGGSFCTIRATASDARRRYPDVKIYRNGKELR